MAVRLATKDDFEAVLSLVNLLLKELGGEPLTEEAAVDAYARLSVNGKTGFALLAEDSSRAIGVCTVSFQDAIRVRGRYAIIQEMYVVPELRSAGIGSKLVERAVDEARALGCAVIELGTPAGGRRQEKFYERLGFAPVGLRLRRVLENA